jgi:hypothetical protein
VKQTLTALLVVLLFATIVVLAADRRAEKSDADILIARIKADYTKALRDADAFYAKQTAPFRKARDKRIIASGNNAIRRLNTARREVSELRGIKMEKEIEKIRKSIDNQFGDAPKVTPKTSVLKVCGISFKGHTYLAIASGANWKEAAAMCKKLGGHLAYVETAEELTFLAKTFPHAQLWLGATDAHKEGDWRWGNGRPVLKNLWKKGEPSKGNTEHHAGIKSSWGERKLNDVAWNDKYLSGFICEWE